MTKTTLINLVLGITTLLLPATVWAKSFGSAVTLQQPTAVADALSHPENFKGKDVLLAGEIKEVCQKKGCWMFLRQGDKDIRVTFKDYKIFIPKDSKDKPARVQGEIVVKEMTEKEARHYLEDQGKPKAEIEKIKGSQTQVTFIAAAVDIQ